MSQAENNFALYIFPLPTTLSMAMMVYSQPSAIQNTSDTKENIISFLIKIVDDISW